MKSAPLGDQMNHTETSTKDFSIFIDGTPQPNSAPTYQISICPFTRGGGASALASKEYPTREALDTDLRKYLGFTDAGIERYFASPDLHHALVHPLSDEVAAYFGW
jgi:hypothetical protein